MTLLCEKRQQGVAIERDLGRKDSNLRMTGSKPAALPLGHAPRMISTMTIPYFDSSVNLSFSFVGCLCGEGRDGKKLFQIFVDSTDEKPKEKKNSPLFCLVNKRNLFLFTSSNGRIYNSIELMGELINTRHCLRRKLVVIGE